MTKLLTDGVFPAPESNDGLSNGSVWPVERVELRPCTKIFNYPHQGLLTPLPPSRCTRHISVAMEPRNRCSMDTPSSETSSTLPVTRRLIDSTGNLTFH